MDADFLLVYKIKNKDEMAGEVFVKKYYSAIFRYSFLHLHNYAEAQDVTQETFLLFFEKIERYRSYGKALNYLYVIARNVCRDYWKKKKPLYLEEMKEDNNVGSGKNKKIHPCDFSTLCIISGISIYCKRIAV